MCVMIRSAMRTESAIAAKCLGSAVAPSQSAGLRAAKIVAASRIACFLSSVVGDSQVWRGGTRIIPH
jgi:hypothetical protein